MHSTGKALVPSKKWYSVISFKWTNDKWKYRERRLPLYINDPDVKRSPFKQLHSNESEKYLSTQIAVDGNMKDQILKLREKEKTGMHTSQLAMFLGKTHGLHSTLLL